MSAPQDNSDWLLGGIRPKRKDRYTFDEAKSLVPRSHLSALWTLQQKRGKYISPIDPVKDPERYISAKDLENLRRVSEQDAQVVAQRFKQRRAVEAAGAVTSGERGIARQVHSGAFEAPKKAPTPEQRAYPSAKKPRDTSREREYAGRPAWMPAEVVAQRRQDVKALGERLEREEKAKVEARAAALGSEEAARRVKQDEYYREREQTAQEAVQGALGDSVFGAIAGGVASTPARLARYVNGLIFPRPEMTNADKVMTVAGIATELYGGGSLADVTNLTRAGFRALVKSKRPQIVSSLIKNGATKKDAIAQADALAKAADDIEEPVFAEAGAVVKAEKAKPAKTGKGAKPQVSERGAAGSTGQVVPESGAAPEPSTTPVSPLPETQAAKGLADETRQAMLDAGRSAQEANAAAFIVYQAAKYAEQNGLPLEQVVAKAVGDIDPTGKLAQIALTDTEQALSITTLAPKTKEEVNRSFAERVQQRVHEVFGGKIDTKIPENREMLARVMAHDAHNEIATNPNNNALGWYERKVSEALRLATKQYPELASDEGARGAYTFALAVTSNGQKVAENFKWADQVYDHWKRTGQMPLFGKGAPGKQMKEAFRFWNENVPAGADPVQFLKFLNTDFTVAEARAMGINVSGEWADQVVSGAHAVGPKIGGGFLRNLSGYFDSLTSDRWFMRTWGRMTGNLVNESVKAEAELIAKFKAALSSVSDEELARYGFTREMLDDEDALIELAEGVHKQFAKKNAAGKTYTDKRPFTRAAKNLDDFSKNTNDAPTAEARAHQRMVVERTKELLKQEYGIDITTADLQALVWYPEQRAWGAGGNAVDYADAARSRYGNLKNPEIHTSLTDPSYKLGSLTPADRLGEQRSRVLGRLRRSLYGGLGKGSDAGRQALPSAYARRSNKSGSTLLADGSRAKITGTYSMSQTWKNAIETILRPNGARAIPTPTVYEVGAGDFHRLISNAVESLGDNGAPVHVYSPEEYAQMRVFIAEDGTAGFAIKPDGDIVSVFRHGDSPHQGVTPAMMQLAIDLGGKKLDAFDTATTRLPSLYGRSGFKEVARMKFDINEAPSWWNVETMGEPDVVFMVHDPSFPGGKPARAPYVDAYDEALRLQDQAIAAHPSPTLMQKGAEGVKGFYTAETRVIELVKGKADISTVIHETGHHIKEVLLQGEHADRIRRLYGGSDDVAGHERFARHLEHYFRTGNAPTPELADIFARIKEWMKTIYAKWSGDKPTDEVKSIFGDIFSDVDDVSRQWVDAGDGAKPGRTKGLVDETQPASDLTQSAVDPTASRTRKQPQSYQAPALETLSREADPESVTMGRRIIWNGKGREFLNRDFEEAYDLIDSGLNDVRRLEREAAKATDAETKRTLLSEATALRKGIIEAKTDLFEYMDSITGRVDPDLDAEFALRVGSEDMTERTARVVTRAKQMGGTRLPVGDLREMYSDLRHLAGAAIQAGQKYGTWVSGLVKQAGKKIIPYAQRAWERASNAIKNANATRPKGMTQAGGFGRVRVPAAKEVSAPAHLQTGVDPKGVHRGAGRWLKATLLSETEAAEVATKELGKRVGKDLTNTELDLRSGLNELTRLHPKVDDAVMKGIMGTDGKRASMGVPEILDGLRRDGIDPDLWQAYRRALREMDIADRGGIPGDRLAENTAFVDDFLTTHGDAVARWDEEAGRFFDAQLDLYERYGLKPVGWAEKTRNENPFYYPLIPSGTDTEKTMRALNPQAGLASPMGKVIRAIGGNQYQDGFASMASKTEQLITEGEKNLALLPFMDEMSKQADQTWVRDVTPQIKAQIAEEKARELAKAKRMVGLEADDLPDLFGQPKPLKEGDDPILTLYQNGEARYFEVDPYIWKAIQGLNPQEFNAVQNILRVAAQPARFFTTGKGNPLFGFMFNPMIDIMSGVVNHGLNPLRAAQGFWHALLAKFGKETKLWRDVIESNVLFGQGNTKDFVEARRFFDAGSRKALDKEMQSAGVRALHTMGDFYSAIRDAVEEGTRVGMFAQQKAAGLRKGLSPKAASKQASQMAADLFNFGEPSTLGRTLSGLGVPYANIVSQAAMSAARGFKRNPAKFMARMGAILTVPALWEYQTYKNDKEWQSLPDYVKMGGVTFRTGALTGDPSAGDWVSLRVPAELGVVFRGIPMRVAEAMESGEYGQAAKDELNSMADQWTPSFMPTLIAAAGQTAFYTGSGATPDLRFFTFRSFPVKENAKETAKAKAQYKFIKQQMDTLFGSMGRTATQGVAHVLDPEIEPKAPSLLQRYRPQPGQYLEGQSKAKKKSPTAGASDLIKF